MNGALTIGTLDGANVEIREQVGAENFFLFGLSSDEVAQAKRAGYSPRTVLAGDPELASILEEIRSGALTPDDPHVLEPLVSSLIEHDPFLVLADFRAYVEAQGRVSRAWQDPDEWSRQAVLNVARSGYFSSDRSIREYAQKVWNMKPERVGHP